MALKRPILVGGLGLAGSLWLLEWVNQSPISPGLLGLMALGAGGWWLRRSQPEATPAPLPPVSRAAVDQALAQVDQALAAFTEELPDDAAQPPQLADWQGVRSHLSQLSDAELAAQPLTVGILGTPGVGKSSLVSQLQAWSAAQPQAVNWQELPELAEVAAAEAELSPDAATECLHQPELQACDALVLLTVGDLTESQHQLLKTLVTAGYPVQLVLNKQDSLPPLDRAVVMQRIQTRLNALERVGDGVAIAAAPKPLKVRTHDSDGTSQERWEQPQPDISALTERLAPQISEQGTQWQLGRVLRQATHLRRQVQTGVNQLRRDRALPQIEQYQWIAAAAAFANPVPTLDLVAVGAINAQLVADLGKIYQQKLSLDQAKAAAAALARLTVKLGLVELSSQTLAGLLKTQAATYVAGGIIQALSAAHLTRVAGLSLVDYFETRSLAGTPDTSVSLSPDILGPILQRRFQQTRAILPSLVQQGLRRLPGSTATTNATLKPDPTAS